VLQTWSSRGLRRAARRGIAEPAYASTAAAHLLVAIIEPADQTERLTSPDAQA
jgi:hypothetical protein